MSKKYIPFSNASEAESWKEFNCEQCKKYNSEMIDTNEPGCKLGYYIDIGFVTGDIPKKIADLIGYTSIDHNKLTVYLNNDCSKKEQQ